MPLTFWVLLALVGFLPVAAWAQEPATDASSTEEAAPAEAEAEADDSEWIMDDERGRRFRVAQVPKKGLLYRWLDENRVRFRGGAWFEVVRHDEDYFWVKEWEPPKRDSEAKRAAAERRWKPPSEEELAAAAATYVTSLEQVDQLDFAPFETGLPRSGQWRNGFELADFNQDGHTDIVFGAPRKGRPAPFVFLGDSAGSWRVWTEAGFPAMPYDYGDPAVGDFNGDGRPDAAFGIHLRGMLAVASKPDGGYEPWTEGIQFDLPGSGGDAGSFSSRAVAAIDWNKDGRTDLLALGEGPKGQRSGPGGQTKGMVNSSRGFVLYLNNGDGTWETVRPKPDDGLARDFGDDFVLGDFNGDGHTDALVASRRMGNRKIVYYGTADGQLVNAELPGLRPRGFVASVGADDFNGDGRTDLLIGFINSEKGVWRAGLELFVAEDGDTWDRRTITAEEGRVGFSSMSTGDLNGDGKLDLVGLTNDGRVRVFIGDGQGGLRAEVSPELPNEIFRGCTGYDVALHDLDGDGRDEIVASFAGERTGVPGMQGLDLPGCPREGSVRVWKPAPKAQSASAGR